MDPKNYHHNEIIRPGVGGEVGYFTTDIRLVLTSEKAFALAAFLEDLGYVNEAEEIREIR